MIRHHVEARGDATAEGGEELGGEAFGGAVAGVGLVAELIVTGEAAGDFGVVIETDAGIEREAAEVGLAVLDEVGLERELVGGGKLIRERRGEFVAVAILALDVVVGAPERIHEAGGHLAVGGEHAIHVEAKAVALIL